MKNKCSLSPKYKTFPSPSYWRDVAERPLYTHLCFIDIGKIWKSLVSILINSIYEWN